MKTSEMRWGFASGKQSMQNTRRVAVEIPSTAVQTIVKNNAFGVLSDSEEPGSSAG